MANRFASFGHLRQRQILGTSISFANGDAMADNLKSATASNCFVRSLSTASIGESKGPGRTRLLVLVALFGSLHGLLSAVPGVWGPAEVARSFVIFVESLEGIILGPRMGFISGSIGCILGRIIRPREEGFLLGIAFGMGEPIASLVAGLMFRRKWHLAALAYAVMLGTFLTDPLTWSARIPLWSIWDTLLAAFMILPAHIAVRSALEHRGDAKRLGPAVCLVAFVSTEADMLFRIFLLVPTGLYALYPIPVEALPVVFILGALVTPVEALLSMAVSVILAVPVLLAIERSRSVRWPME